MERPCLSIAVLVKQVPRFDRLQLGTDGRLVRTDIELELNPYCRRAVSKGVEIARESGGRCTVFTLGPPTAEDCLREAIACGADDGVLVTDPAFAGSDTLATAQALTSAVRRFGPFDLVVCGRNSVDADTAQTPAQVAELLDLPMVAGVRSLTILGETLIVRCEHDDEWMDARVRMPALITCAERLTNPAKSSSKERAEVCASRITRLNATSLGPGPWGEAASMTAVGSVKGLDVARMRRRLHGDLDAQVERAVYLLAAHGAFNLDPVHPTGMVPASAPAKVGDPVAVVVEPNRDRMTRELLGAAALLASARRTHTVALASSPIDRALVGSWGADVVVSMHCPNAGDIDGRGYPEEDVAAFFTAWCAGHRPWAVLAPSTMWGREVAGRMAARLGVGLVGDAIELVADHHGRLTCWKPAFGGSLVAGVTCLSRTQMATVRIGVLPLLKPRSSVAAQAISAAQLPRNRVRVTQRTRDDDIDLLAAASVVVVVGAGVPPEEYPLVTPLLHLLGAELAATRKVTDQGWQPRARQVGITGRSVAPRLFVAIGTSGKFNHMVGARCAKTILGINNDPAAPIFEAVDVGIVADWRAAVPRLVEVLERSVPCADLPSGRATTPIPVLRET